jgi:hypothetical protein
VIQMSKAIQRLFHKHLSTRVVWTVMNVYFCLGRSTLGRPAPPASPLSLPSRPHHHPTGFHTQRRVAPLSATPTTQLHHLQNKGRVCLPCPPHALPPHETRTTHHLSPPATKGMEWKQKVSLFDVVDETSVSTKLGRAASNGVAAIATGGNSYVSRWNGRCTRTALRDPREASCAPSMVAETLCSSFIVFLFQHIIFEGHSVHFCFSWQDTIWLGL